MSKFYCQSDIEDDGICKLQCDHCRRYYKPLEEDLKLSQMNQPKWTKTRYSKPRHKDLVLARRKDGLVMPSIYFNNQDFRGFYPYTNFYVNEQRNNYYDEVYYNKFVNIIEWMLIPE